jgi:hypothetical protein
MAEAIHEVAHEATHHAAHAGGHAKKIGLLISILALFLAVAEMLGKSAQTNGLAVNIEASNTWNFFQAKTVRQTSVRTMIENARLNGGGEATEAQKQIQAWQANVDRWESEPSTGEGRKELMAKARGLEQKRDALFAEYHAYEIAALILQLGIVLASVTLLSSMMVFAAGSLVLGITGVVFLAGTYFHWPFIARLLH